MNLAGPRPAVTGPISKGNSGFALHPRLNWVSLLENDRLGEYQNTALSMAWRLKNTSLLN